MGVLRLPLQPVWPFLGYDSEFLRNRGKLLSFCLVIFALFFRLFEPFVESKNLSFKFLRRNLFRDGERDREREIEKI